MIWEQEKETERSLGMRKGSKRTGKSTDSGKKDIYGTDKIKKTYFCVVLNKMAPIRLIDLNACLPMSCTIWND